MSEINESEIQGKLQDLDKMQSDCTRCGICLESCSTYQATGWEHESPRGRIQLAEHLMEGKIHPDSSALESFDRCLGCQACENACPLGVKYNSIKEIVQEVRVALNPGLKTKKEQATHFKWVYRLGHRLWRAFGWQWLIPAYVKGLSITSSYLYKKKQLGSPQSVTLIVSCLQDISQHELIDQTVNLLKNLNVSAVLDRSQPCCGALFERINSSKKVLSYQEKCRQKFQRWMPQSVIFLSQNCRQFILRHHSSQSEIIDLYNLISKQLEFLKIKPRLKNPLTVYYQSYCAQKGEDTALQVLKTIEGLEVKLLWPPKSCCGGYGGETIFNPAQAALLGQAKGENLPLGAVMIVTSPDCYVQFAQRSDLTILYPVQLLSRACLVTSK